MDPMESMANSAGPIPNNFNADDAGNIEDVYPPTPSIFSRTILTWPAPQMEKQFAVKVVQHMQTYWSILEKVKGSSLRLTKIDEDIYAHLQEAFPDFDPAKKIDEDEMKSKSGKQRWRDFMMQYEKKVDDYNFGTMVRNDAKAEYDEDTTIFGKHTKFRFGDGGAVTNLLGD